MSSGKKVAFHNLGCKVNSYETEAMLQKLVAQGYESVPFEPGADLYVINTCSVTNVADRKSRQMLHKAKAMNPEAVIVAVGCYAQAVGEALLEDDAVDIIVGNDRKNDLPDILEAYYEEKTKQAALIEIGESRSFEEMDGGCSDRTRAYLKIEDGCNQFCSYCLIPFVRGRVRSRDPRDVYQEACRLVEAGYPEIVLTGIHISSYGLDMKGDSIRSGHYGEPLLELLKLLDTIPGLKRLRLGSLEPRVITPDFAKELAKLKTLCPHFHLSLQSGCDTVLKRMNRKYTAAEFLAEMEALRAAFPEPALTTDVIVGFPGETEEEFEETVEFLKKAKFYETHIFKYSRRKGTAADRMPGQLTEKQKAERSAVLQALNREHKRAYEARLLGTEQEILVEEVLQQRGKTLVAGHTRDYVRLIAEAGEHVPGELIRLTVKEENLSEQEDI